MAIYLPFFYVYVRINLTLKILKEKRADCMRRIYLMMISILCFTLIFSGCKKETKKEERVEKIEVTLYFPDENVMNLEKETREIEVEESVEKSVLLEVFKGPRNEKLIPSVRGDIKIISTETENGICIVNLSSEFTKNNTGGSAQESMAIMSIVKSLCEIEGIDKVKINIEGDENPEFGGHFSLEEPFSPDGI